MSTPENYDIGYREAVTMLLEKAEAQNVTDTSEGFMCSCLIPPHQGHDSTPSFAINAETGAWRCYGCKAKGGLVHLAAVVLGIDISAAKKTLLKYESRHAFNFVGDARGKRKETALMPEAVLFPFSGHCPTYMLERGFSKSFLRRFEIGFDMFSAAVVFPIRSISGKLVGLTRRTVQSNVYPKYKHTAGWSKGDHLYLGTYATEAAKAQRGSVVIFTEGHVDALNAWKLAEKESKLRKALAKLEYPFVAAVAIMGSSMTLTQAKVAVRHLNCRIALCAFDNDDAGFDCLYGTEQAHLKKARYKLKEPVGALEALLTAGCREIYRVGFAEKDPGELKETSEIELEDLT